MVGVALLVALQLGALANAEGSDPGTCEALAQRLGNEVTDRVEWMRARSEAFASQQATDREEFARQTHTAEEEQAFAAREHETARDFYARAWREFTGLMREKLDEYRAACGSYEAKALAGWRNPEPPVPSEFRSSEPQPARPAEPSPKPAYGCPPHEARPPTEPQPAQAQPAQPSGQTLSQSALTASGDQTSSGNTTAPPPEEQPPPTAQPQPAPPPERAPPPPPEQPPAAHAPPPCPQPGPHREPTWTSPSTECRDAHEEARAEMERFMASMEEERRTFMEQQGKERAGFAASEHTEDEQRAFAERQAQAAMDHHKAWEQRIEAQRQATMHRVQAACPHTMGEPAKPACAGDAGARERARAALEHDLRAARDAFEAQWRERWEAFQAAHHDDAERAAFKHEATQAHVAFDEQMRAKWEGWAKEHPAPAPCGRPYVVEDRACSPERMRAEAEEFGRHLRERYFGARGDYREWHDAVESKMRAIEQEWRAKRADLDAGDPTPEERAAFEARAKEAFDHARRAMEQERERFEERMRSEGQAFEAKLRGEMERFMKAQAERCWGATAHEGPPPAAKPGEPARPPPKPMKVREIYEDLEVRRMQCMLEVRIQLQDFEAARLRELRDFVAAHHDQESIARFEAGHHEARKALEAKLQLTRGACEGALRDAHDEARREEQRGAPPQERMGSFVLAMDEAKGEARIQGAHVAFTGDQASESIYGYTVDGQLFLDAIRKQTRFTDFDMDQQDGQTAMVIRGEGLRYRFHDNPAGVANFAVKDGTIELDVADYLSVKSTDRGIELSDGKRRALVMGHGLSLEGDRITLTGEATFLVQDQQHDVLEKVANKHRGDIHRAVEAKRVAAELTLVQGSDGPTAEPVTYQDMKLQVEKPKAAGRVSVRIDNPDHEGRTVVLNLDKGLFADLARLEAKVFDLDGGGERDAGAVKASSLADVLDPTDDSKPEYWVVTDEDGAQVLVSFPHFSEKRVEVMSAGSETIGGLRVPGPDPLLLLGALGVAVLLSRRR